LASVILEQIKLTSDFTCGAGEDSRQLGSDYYALTIPADPSSTEVTQSYCWFFCVCLSNLSEEPQSITVDMLRPDHTISETFWLPTKVPLFISDDFHRWYVLDEVKSTPSHEDFRARLVLASGQAIYLTNSLPYPAAWMRNWLKQIVARHRLVSLYTIGQTVQGRDMLILTITDPSVDTSIKDRILVTSGFHPAEPDWLATITIIEALLGDEEWAVRVRQDFVVDIVPQCNPDGYDLGTNASNANAINMYWDFRRDDMEASPEAVHLWRWIEAHPPSLYLDFHAYVHQLEKNFRPYLRPKADYPRPARPVVQAIDKDLISLCEGRYVVGKNTSDPRTLAAQMTAAFGTITYPKFHLHLNHGVTACRRLGLDVFRVVVENAWPYRPLYSRTVGADRPRGVANQLLRWVEQGDLPLRARRGWRSLVNLLGLQSPVFQGVSSASGSGLAPHWREHFWSQRGQARPVIVIDETGIR
jgi:hypothetical protein